VKCRRPAFVIDRHRHPRALRGCRGFQQLDFETGATFNCSAGVALVGLASCARRLWRRKKGRGGGGVSWRRKANESHRTGKAQSCGGGSAGVRSLGSAGILPVGRGVLTSANFCGGVLVRESGALAGKGPAITVKSSTPTDTPAKFRSGENAETSGAGCSRSPEAADARASIAARLTSPHRRTFPHKLLCLRQKKNRGLVHARWRRGFFAGIWHPARISSGAGMSPISTSWPISSRANMRGW